jgi:outer membrane murein-binding lipoprotein Lpp
MPDQDKTELASRSDELLETIQRLKDTEQRKRQEPISSEAFHRLANEVDALSHEVFAIARDQRTVGERTPRADESIEDIAGQLDDTGGREDR